MQDRFKFRAWHKEKQEMHNIDGLYAYDSEYTEGGEVFFKEDSSPKNSYYFPEEVELMQCTGLKDKNGKLIYEGDILKIDNPFEESKKILMPVKWTTNLHNTGFSFNQDFANNTEVIGNIYENKELINANIQS